MDRHTVSTGMMLCVVLQSFSSTRAPLHFSFICRPACSCLTTSRLRRYHWVRQYWCSSTDCCIIARQWWHGVWCSFSHHSLTGDIYFALFQFFCLSIDCSRYLFALATCSGSMDWLHRCCYTISCAPPLTVIFFCFLILVTILDDDSFGVFVTYTMLEWTNGIESTDRVSWDCFRQVLCSCIVCLLIAVQK